MKAAYSLKGLFAGAIFSFVYVLLALIALGAGHGTSMFLAPIKPFGLGLLFFPIIGFLAGNLNSFFTKSLLLIVLAIHYGLTVTFIKMFWTDDLPYFEKMWHYSPISIILPAALYLLGNTLVYTAFIYSSAQRKKLNYNLR
jgi:hypothetical protein